MNLLEQIATHLEFCGFGKRPDENGPGDIYWGTMPSSPDKCIGIFSSDSGYRGSENGARIQIIVRADTDLEAYTLAQDITEELADFDGFLGGDGAWVRIAVTNSATGLGADTKTRPLYSSNYVLHYCDY